MISCRLGRDASTIGLWHFNEGSGTTIKDYSGRAAGLTSVCYSGGATSWVGTELKFGNAINTSLQIVDNNVLSFTNNIMTVECNVKFNSLKDQWIVTKGNGSNYEWGLWYQTISSVPKISFCFWPLSGATNLMLIQVPYTFVTGQYYHIAGTCDGTLGTLYVNGVSVGTATATGYMANGTAHMEVGNRMDLLTNSAWYPDSYIKNVRLWNIYRTQSQIQGSMATSLSGFETGLIINMPLNEGTGITFFNQVYNTPGNGTITNGTYISALLGTGVSFNGTSTYITVSNNPPLNPTDAITLELVFKSNAIQTGMFLCKTNESQYRIFKDTDDKLYANLTTGGVSKGLVSTSTLGTKWHYAVLTYDGLNIRLFLDGIQEAIVSATGNIAVTTGVLYFGKQDTNAYFCNGIITCARVSKIARSAQEIKYNWLRKQQILMV